MIEVSFLMMVIINSLGTKLFIKNVRAIRNSIDAQKVKLKTQLSLFMFITTKSIQSLIF